MSLMFYIWKCWGLPGNVLLSGKSVKHNFSRHKISHRFVWSLMLAGAGAVICRIMRVCQTIFPGILAILRIILESMDALANPPSVSHPQSPSPAYHDTKGKLPRYTEAENFQGSLLPAVLLLLSSLVSR